MLIYHTDESIKEIINAFTPSLMFTNLALFMHNRNIHDNVFYSFVYKHKPMEATNPDEDIDKDGKTSEEYINDKINEIFNTNKKILKIDLKEFNKGIGEENNLFSVNSLNNLSNNSFINFTKTLFSIGNTNKEKDNNDENESILSSENNNTNNNILKDDISNEQGNDSFIDNITEDNATNNSINYNVLMVDNNASNNNIICSSDNDVSRSGNLSIPLGVFTNIQNKSLSSTNNLNNSISGINQEGLGNINNNFSFNLDKKNEDNYYIDTSSDSLSFFCQQFNTQNQENDVSINLGKSSNFLQKSGIMANNPENKKQKYSSLTKKTLKYSQMSINDLISNIYDIARKQSGCRYLQNLLESNTIGNIKLINDIIFPSLYPNKILSLCIDFFGNYFIQKIMNNLSKDNLTKLSMLIFSYFLQLSIDPHGTRVVQELNKVIVINIINNEELLTLFKNNLSSNLSELIYNHHGGFVILNYATLTGSPRNEFIFTFLFDNIIKVATTNNSCCILQKCLSVADKNQEKVLMIKLAEVTPELIANEKGNYVMQFILSKNNVEVNDIIIHSLLENILELSKQKYSSNVIEKCLDHCSNEMKKKIIISLKKKSTIVELLHDMYGNYVLQKVMMCTEGEERQYFFNIIIGEIHNLKDCPFGQKLTFKLLLTFPELRQALIRTQNITNYYNYTEALNLLDNNYGGINNLNNYGMNLNNINMINTNNINNMNLGEQLTQMNIIRSLGNLNINTLNAINNINRIGNINNINNLSNISSINNLNNINNITRNTNLPNNTNFTRNFGNYRDYLNFNNNY